MEETDFRVHCNLLNKLRVLVFGVNSVLQDLVSGKKISVDNLFMNCISIQTIEEGLHKHMLDLGFPENSIIMREDVAAFMKQKQERAKEMNCNNISPEQYMEELEKAYTDFFNQYVENGVLGTKKVKDEIDTLNKLYGGFTL